MLLCIETSTAICSVCLANDGEILATNTITEPYQHASQTIDLIDRSLDQAHITQKSIRAVAVSEGPGSFTGLRVGLATAKGLCFALGIPLITIPTLQAIAYGAKSRDLSPTPSLYCAMLDARRMEVYAAIYDAGLKALTDAQAMEVNRDFFSSHRTEIRHTVFVGNAVHKLHALKEFGTAKTLNLDCSADFMVDLALSKYKNRDYSDPRSATPKYLKPPNITKARKVI